MTLKTLRIFQKGTAKPYSFPAIDANLALDNPLCCKKNLAEKIWKLVMTIDDKIRDEKLQYDINRERAKKSALLFGKIDPNKYLTVEEILLFDQSRVEELAKFIYSPIGKALKKETKTIKDQVKSK